MRSRQLLHVNDLNDFSNFLKSHGWQINPPKGEWEVLRAVREDHKDPLLVYTKAQTHRGNPVRHLTTFGLSLEWAHMYYDNKDRSK